MAYQDLPGSERFGQLASLETALARRQNGQFNYIGVCALISQLMSLQIARRRIIQSPNILAGNSKALSADIIFLNKCKLCLLFLN